nr:calcium/calmodulin-dependent 3',5'-cyclic nucleotide phosphodiesterase 1B [Anser cygnoides]
MFRRTYTAVGPSYSTSVLNCLKSLDLWCFDVFALNRVTEEHSLRTIVYELFTRHNLNSRFKIPAVFLTSLLDALEAGYGKYKNPYHNQAHAADVTQTVHCFLLRTGMLHYLTEIEVLAIIFAAAIHDYEHTGTTNSFHIQTKSDCAILYNDRSVLENHHISAVFRMMQDDEMNIFVNLTKDEFAARGECPGGGQVRTEQPPTLVTHRDASRPPPCVPPPGITNQASIEELSPYEEEPPAPPSRHKHNGEVE